MTWVVLTVVLGVVFWASIGWWLLTKGKSDGAIIGLGSAGLTAVAYLVLGALLSVHTIGQRQVGIIYNFSGTITGKKDPGVVTTWPWQHVKRENVGLQREDFDLDVNNAAVSKDQQAIYARLTVNFQVQPANVVKLFKEVGPAWKATLLDSRVLQDFKEVTSLYSAAQITTSRSQLRADTKARLIKEMRPYDIRIIDVFVRNIDYTQSYKNAVNAKNVQVQKSLQAEAKVSQATAEAQQAVAIAKGNAEAIRLKGQALRNNPEVLQLEAIDKLNPNAQVIFCTGTGSGNCPSFLPQQLGVK